MLLPGDALLMVAVLVMAATTEVQSMGFFPFTMAEEAAGEEKLVQLVDRPPLRRFIFRCLELITLVRLLLLVRFTESSPVDVEVGKTGDTPSLAPVRRWEFISRNRMYEYNNRHIDRPNESRMERNEKLVSDMM